MDLNVDTNTTPKERDEIWRRMDAWLTSVLPEMIAMRRNLHAHPEPAGEEVRTTQILREHLDQAGLQLSAWDDLHGLIADVQASSDVESHVAIRADIDCVEVEDEKDVEWRSTRDGCCHACGHDAHATMACFAAMAVQREAKAISPMMHRGDRFIFQPAEEAATGASDMIARGAIQQVDQIVALHCEPYLDTGRVGVRNGPITSHLRSFSVRLKGRGGHSARPHDSIDPIPAAVNLVSLLYQLAPRSVDSRRAHCITVTALRAGDAINAIPESAVVHGTIRAARLEEAQTLEQMVRTCAESACTATGCVATIDFPHAAPATDNDPEVVSFVAQAAADVVGAEGVIRLDLPSLGGEDFAIYQKHIPGAMVRLGTGHGPHEQRQPLHSGWFDIDESALLVGARLLARTALKQIWPHPG